MAATLAGDLGSHVHPNFDFPDADVILRCPVPVDEEEHGDYDAFDAFEHPVVNNLFRIHKAKLANLSATFRDMFELPASSTTTAAGLPVVDVQESTQEMRMLLPYFYDDMPPQQLHLDGDNVQRVLSLWGMADKYQVHVLFNLLSDAVQHKLLSCNPYQALQIYAMSSKVGNAGIAATALQLSLKGDYSSYSREHIVGMSAAALHALALGHAGKYQQQEHLLRQEKITVSNQRDQLQVRCRKLDSELKRCKEQLKQEEVCRKLLCSEITDLQTEVDDLSAGFEAAQAKINASRPIDGWGDNGGWGSTAINRGRARRSGGGGVGGGNSYGGADASGWSTGGGGASWYG